MLGNAVTRRMDLGAARIVGTSILRSSFAAWETLVTCELFGRQETLPLKHGVGAA